MDERQVSATRGHPTSTDAHEEGNQQAPGGPAGPRGRPWPLTSRLLNKDRAGSTVPGQPPASSPAPRPAADPHPARASASGRALPTRSLQPARASSSPGGFAPSRDPRRTLHLRSRQAPARSRHFTTARRLPRRQVGARLELRGPARGRDAEVSPPATPAWLLGRDEASGSASLSEQRVHGGALLLPTRWRGRGEEGGEGLPPSPGLGPGHSSFPAVLFCR